MGRSLRYREDGTFTIVQFTDLHWHNGEPGDQRTRRLMEEIIRLENPDFLVFTGDIIFRPKCADYRRSFRDALEVAERSGLPWAAVFGNHDSDDEAERRALMDVMRGMKGCLAEPGPPGVHGVGNYVVCLEDAKGRAQTAMFFFDTGAKSELPGIPGYDWIRRSQIDWYAEESARLAQENGGKGVPSLAFFHIPLPEYEELWRTQMCYGRRHEKAGSSRVNSGLFAAMAERGDVAGTFCGHDHTNDYGGRLLGISLYYGRSSGYQGYGWWGFKRGGRVIRLQAGKRSFRTWVRLADGRKISRPHVHRPWAHWIQEGFRKLFY